jgi:cytochrome c-type biogenesis protein
LLSFLEGVITFISPCFLPLLPVYMAYFAGDDGGRRGNPAPNALFFVAGFTAVFIVMGMLAGSAGALLARHQRLAGVISGSVIVLLGLNFLGLLPFDLFSLIGGWRKEGSGGSGKNEKKTGPLAAVLLGMTFSVLWTPCVGAFLGSALMMASREGSSLRGGAMLLCFSAGLGLPLLASAMLIDMLKSTFSFIKRNYRIVNGLAGAFLIVMGVLMITGLYGRWI